MDDDSALKNTFKADFVPLVEEYIKQIKRILEKYGTVVFVARKAACFYLALRAKGILEDSPTCKSISSRALGYSGLEFGEGGIAIIDDVMVSGTSVLVAKQLLEENDLSCDVFVAARSIGLVREEVKDMRISAIRDLEASQIYELAREITSFIQSAAVTNNVDQPIFHVTFVSDGSFDDVFVEREWIDLSTREQIKNDVMSKVLPYDPSSLFDDLIGTLVNTDDVVCKVRLLSDADHRFVTVVPFVILPEIDSFLVEALFQLVAYEGLCDCVLHPNPDEELRNKLRVIQYALARYLGERFVDGLEGVESSTIDEFNETFLFGRKIDRFLRPNPLVSESVDACAALSVDSRKETALLDAGVVCSSLLADSRRASEYRCAGHPVVDFSMTTMYQMRSLLKRAGSFERADAEGPSFSSACVDVLVDRGFLVPFIATRQKGGRQFVVRAYRGGEVLKRTIYCLRCFCLALFRYQDQSRSSLPVSVANKLGALFLRWFDPSDEASAGEVAVYALVFEPRKNHFLVQGHQSLIDLLVAMDYVCVADGSIVGPGSSYKRDSIYLEDERAGRYFASVFAEAKRSLPGQVDFERLLDYMVVGFGWRYRVRCLKPQISMVESKLKGYLDGLLAGEELIACCDEALSWQKIAASHKDLDDFLEKTSLRMGQEVYVLSRFCQDGGSKSVDVADSERLIQEVGSFLDEAKSLCKLNVGFEPSQSAGARLLDKADVLARIFETLEYNDHEFKYTRRDVSMVSAIVPDRNGRKFSFATCCQGEDRVECAKTAIKREPDSQLFVCFPDNGIPASLISHPSANPIDRIGGLYPKRIRNAIQNFYKLLNSDEPPLLAVYKVAGESRVRNIPFSLLEGTVYVAYRELDSGTSYCRSLDIEGYELAIYALKERDMGDVFKDCTIGATRPKSSVIDQSRWRTGDNVVDLQEIDWEAGLKSIVEILAKEHFAELKRVQVTADYLKSLAASKDESLVEDKRDAFKKLSTILQSSAAAIAIFDKIAPAIRMALGLP